MFAASKGFGAVVRVLLEKSADTNLVCNTGQTAIDIARHHGFNAVGFSTLFYT